MYIFNGKKLTEDQAKKFAEETGRDLQTFLEANPDIQKDPEHCNWILVYWNYQTLKVKLKIVL
jgi:hypothetical protein